MLSNLFPTYKHSPLIKYVASPGKELHKTMPGFCLSQIRPHVRVRSQSILPKTLTNSRKVDSQKADGFGKVFEDECEKPRAIVGRRIMVVVDSGIEAKVALQWALTQTVQSHDVVILLYVNRPSKQGDENSRKEIAPRVYEFLQSMKSYCKLKRPEVWVEIVVAEGKERGPAIVEEAKKQGVAMLVLGQKKPSMTWRLLVAWAGNRVAGSGGVVEYCIQNANCIAIGVRRKSRKLGGYLITTKRHKDFWLLA